MMSALFRCPVCKGSLSSGPLSSEPRAEVAADVRCDTCRVEFGISDAIADFFVPGGEVAGDRNDVWLRPEIAEARDTKYRLCARDLKGMAYCVEEIARRTFSGCRVLEVGAGTGHFTAWLAETVRPGTEIYAFDRSWPMIEKARANTQGGPGITLFRANARGPLPFLNGAFDIVLVRLAPLGLRGVPVVQAAFDLLRPGGWLFEASWRKERFETPPTQWATDHGFESAEHHAWRYRRWQSEEEYLAGLIDGPRMPYECVDVARATEYTAALKLRQGSAEGIPVMTDEELLIARKPDPGT